MLAEVDHLEHSCPSGASKRLLIGDMSQLFSLTPFFWVEKVREMKVVVSRLVMEAIMTLEKWFVPILNSTSSSRNSCLALPESLAYSPGRRIK